jgi:disulfide bond formation protein DsbB
MSVNLFSYILSVCILALGACTLLSVIAYICNNTFRQYIQGFSYTTYMYGIGFLAIVSTISVMVYQLYYTLEVCELCWWQRIFMFPIDIVVLVSLYYRVRTNHIITLILAAFGTFFAGYHYYYHFRGWVLGETVSLPCSVGGLLPACTDNNGIFQFGFITIPYMALTVFVSILVLSCYAHVVYRKSISV